MRILRWATAALLILVSTESGAQSPSLIGIPQASDPACVSGEYWLSVDDAGNVWRKCEDGVISNLDTGGGGGGGAPTNATYLTKTADGTLTNEEVVGNTPGGELGGTWASPTIDSNVIEELSQPSGSDLRYAATEDAYYYDADGDGTRDTNGTENFIDLLAIEVPRDYATVQAAIDSNDCSKGSTTTPQGCRIVVSAGTYAQVFEIGSTALVSADYQNAIVVEGEGFMGAPWTDGGNYSCSVTFTGNNVLNHDTITINGSIGWAIRNLCIDMDASATNDTRYGIAIGTGGAVTKHGVVENVAIFDEGASGGAGIRFGDGASSDVAFNTARNVYMRKVRTCVSSAGAQTVGNAVENVSCSAPTASVGGILVTSGQLSIKRPYMRSGANNQIMIEIGSEAYNSDIYDPTFEIFDDNVTFIRYPNDASSGNYRVHNILGGRFQPLSIPTVKHICIDWNRRGQLNVSGVSFESTTSASRTCEVNAANPHATQKSEINWVSNDVVWGAGTGGIVQPAMVFNESSVGGQLAIHKVEQGSISIGQSGQIVFEGSGLDAFETTIAPTNPTADRTVTLPDANSTTVQAQTCGGTDKVSAISASGVVTCSTDQTGGGGGDAIRVEDGDNGGTFTAATDADFEDSGDINFVRTAGTPDQVSAEIRSGAVGAAEIAAGGLTAADAAADLATQAELEALTLPNSGQTDDRLVKTNGTAGDLEGTGISVDASNNVDGVGTLDTDGAITGPSVATDRPSGTNRSSLVLQEGTTHGTEDFTLITPVAGFASARTCTLQDDATPFDDCVTPGGGGGNSVEVSLALSGGAGFFSTTVTGQAWVTSGSEIVCTPFGTTADGLTPEAIAIGNLSLSVSDRVVGTGFNLNVYSPNGLEGTIRAHCVGV